MRSFCQISIALRREKLILQCLQPNALQHLGQLLGGPFLGKYLPHPTINSFVIKGIGFRLSPKSPSSSPTLPINNQGEICRFKP